VVVGAEREMEDIDGVLSRRIGRDTDGGVEGGPTGEVEEEGLEDKAGGDEPLASPRVG
jgi:hypothetical protein